MIINARHATLARTSRKPPMTNMVVHRTLMSPSTGRLRPVGMVQ